VPTLNPRRLKNPYPVATGGGLVVLTTECDLITRSEVLEGCLVNPFIDIVLLSEGRLRNEGGWKFNSEGCGKMITFPDGATEMAYTNRNLDYLPASHIPEPKMNQLTEEFWQGCSMNQAQASNHTVDQEAMMSMTNEEAVAHWTCFAGVIWSQETAGSDDNVTDADCGENIKLTQVLDPYQLTNLGDLDRSNPNPNSPRSRGTGTVRSDLGGAPVGGQLRRTAGAVGRGLEHPRIGGVAGVRYTA
jgi:hypothetical protein